MDDAFYETYFQPIFLKMAVMNFRYMKKDENFKYTDDHKKFEEILQYALPAITRMFETPDMFIGEAISDSGPTNTTNATNTIVPQVNHTTYNYPVPIPIAAVVEDVIDYDNESIEPSDEETITVLKEMDDRSFILMDQIQQSRIVKVTLEDVDDSDIVDESEEKQDMDEKEDNYTGTLDKEITEITDDYNVISSTDDDNKEDDDPILNQLIDRITNKIDEEQLATDIINDLNKQTHHWVSTA